MLEPETPGSSDPENLGLTADELATFAPDFPDPDDEPEPTPAPASPAVPAASASDAPSAGSAATTPSSSQASPAAPADSASGPASDTPFVIKVDGRELPVEASTLPDGRIAFTPDQWTKLRENYVANRERWVEERRGYRQQVEQARAAVQQLSQQSTVREAEAAALTQAVQDLFQIADPQARWDAMEAMRLALPQHLAKAEAEHWKRQAEQGSARLQPIEQAQRWEAAAPAFWQEVEEALDVYLAQPAYSVLASDRASLLAELRRMGTEERRIGWNGERFIFDQSAFEGLLRTEARFAKRLEDERARAAVDKRNASVLAPAKPAAPQVPVRGAVPAAPQAQETQKITSRAQLREHLNRIAAEAP